MATYRSDVAGEIRDRVTMEEVLQFYGCDTAPNGRIPCPLHNGHDKNFAYKDRSFRCFVCGRNGSVIDFVMELFGLTFPQAVIKISSDFRLGVTSTEIPRSGASKVMEARRAKERAGQEYASMAAEHRRLWEAKLLAEPVLDGDRLFVHPLYVEASKRLPALEYWLDEHLGAGR